MENTAAVRPGLREVGGKERRKKALGISVLDDIV